MKQPSFHLFGDSLCVNGGKLEWTMGDTPNHTLDVETSIYPPASLASNQAAFGP
jgi:putative alpha-1,2-mannosidase